MLKKVCVARDCDKVDYIIGVSTANNLIDVFYR